MLLNLSNHPTSVWQEKQLAEAKRMFGDVVDLPFPRIAPDMAEDELDQLVDEYFQKVLAKSPDAVHIMGEMTFTYRLVQRLKAEGVACIASTTERIVVEDGDRKVTKFNFCRFRKY